MSEPSCRKNGVLMHISSLPSEFGIGTLGRQAYAFADFLNKSCQGYWQILPICPTSFGDSPYQSFSTFAGNPYFIDLELLAKDGYIKKSDWENENFGDDPCRVDYELLYKSRGKLFLKVYQNFIKNIPEGFENFCSENKYWLDDYALFMGIKDEHGGEPFCRWEDDIRRREPQALEYWEDKCKERVIYYKMLQYLFFKQWKELKSYVNSKGIKIIGDLPIYVAADSADVWAEPEQFSLDEDLNPIEVAGCPPDAFSKDGQLWGNPVYDWEYMKKDGYRWWISRLKKCLEIYDIIRVDHFRGFDSYYCIKSGEKTAKKGVWRKGPGIEFWKAMKNELSSLPIIAEDLGFLTDSVRKLLKRSGFPGMKVLQFAFDSREESDYLPYMYEKNSVVYTGTHDNDTIIGWTKTAKAKDVAFAKKYLRAKSTKSLAESMMIAAMASVSDTCILTMQDLLKLGSEARMNTPSTIGGNWEWRMAPDADLSQAQEFLKYNTVLYGRADRKEFDYAKETDS